ncbi:MAG TPA: hypothetical protein PLK75_00510 [Bacteroidales bacterium]|nr:hypothetical protein [Bacteroidales bacterium]
MSKIKITPAQISRLFNKFLLLDDTLRDNLRKYYEYREGNPLNQSGNAAISSEILNLTHVKQTYNTDQYFRRVCYYVNLNLLSGITIQPEPDDRDITRLLKLLALDFIRLYKDQPLTNTVKLLSETLTDKNSNHIALQEPQPIKKQTIALTPLFYWQKPESFIGRKRYLDTLSLHIDSNKYTIINGIKGIGKTSLVQYYVKLKASNFDHMMWINVTKSIKLSLIEAMSRSVAIPQFIAPEINNEAELYQCFTSASEILLQYSGNNLMIIDNAESAAQILDFIGSFEGLNIAWKVIFISSSRIATPIPVRLEKPDPGDAYDMLKSYYLEDIDAGEKQQALQFIESNYQGIHTLLKNLSFNPLLIELIARVDIADELLDLCDIYQIIKGVSSIKHNRLQKPVITRTKDNLPVALSPEECTPMCYIKALFCRDLIHLNDDQKKMLMVFAVLPSQYIATEDLKLISPLGNNRITDLLHSIKGWLKFDRDTSSFYMNELYQFAIREILQPDKTFTNSIIVKIDALIHTCDPNTIEGKKRIEALLEYKRFVEILTCPTIN